MKQSTMLAERIIVRATTARGQWVEKREKYRIQTNTERKFKVLKVYKLINIISIHFLWPRKWLG